MFAPVKNRSAKRVCDGVNPNVLAWACHSPHRRAILGPTEWDGLEEELKAIGIMVGALGGRVNLRRLGVDKGGQPGYHDLMSPFPTVAVLGFRGTGAQVDRIEEGFRTLGCELVPPSDADLVYSNDAGGYEEALAADGDQSKGDAHVILNVLDLCPHCQPPLDIAHIKEQLAYADAITTISSTVQRDIRARLGVEATVVYNPIRNVSCNRQRFPFSRAIFVGRVGDPEKRATVGAAALSILGLGWDDMVTVGREPPPYGGLYVGEISDEVLSGYYNGVDFLMCPTRNAFLGLPILEAMACGTIPVVCRDLDILDEFLPADVFPEYREVEPTAPSIARFVARFMQDNDAKAEFSARVRRHYEAHWADRLSPRGVAQAILNVYQTL